MTELTIGQRIAQERKKQNLSQLGLAARLEVSRQAISKWESDAAIPEVDKLITLSQLFGVSVGWLLGVEEAAGSPEESLSDSQFKIVEELVKKYQTPPRPHLTVFHYLFAISASLLIFLFTYGQTSRIEQQLIRTETAYQEISTRMAALESSLLTSDTPGQLLADYSFDLYPYTKTKSTHRVKVSFSAVPNLWNKEDTGYLCISGGDGGTESTRIECGWDNGRLTAEVALDVANGYELYFTVEHQNGSQEQQILEDRRIQLLAQECAIPIKVERGSFAYQDGGLILTDYTANFTMPAIYENQTSEPSILYCEYRLYRRPQNDSLLQLIRADVMDQLQPSTAIGYRYQVSGEPVRFENVDLANCNHLQLKFYVELSSGVETEIPITIFIPDRKGGLTE